MFYICGVPSVVPPSVRFMHVLWILVPVWLLFICCFALVGLPLLCFAFSFTASLTSPAGLYTPDLPSVYCPSLLFFVICNPTLSVSLCLIKWMLLPCFETLQFSLLDLLLLEFCIWLLSMDIYADLPRSGIMKWSCNDRRKSWIYSTHMYTQHS